MKRCLIAVLSVASIVCSNFSSAAEGKIRIKIDTGFFDREDALVKADIDFKGSVDTASVELSGDDKNIPVLIVPKCEFKAAVYWILQGKTLSMTTKSYVLIFSNGKWSKKTVGPDDLRSKVAESSNLIPNHSFEDVTNDVKKKTNWHGAMLPTEWNLRDYAWHFRKLPDIKSLCRVTDKEVQDGKRSLIFKSQLRKETENGKTINLIGYAVSPIFPLRPDTKYSFSYFIKFVDVKENGGKYQGISASVNFLDGEKKRIYPKNYGLNRLQNAYSTIRHPKSEFLGKWTKTTYIKKTPSEVRYGQVWISGNFTGLLYLDNLMLKSLDGGGKPIKVEISENESN